MNRVKQPRNWTKRLVLLFAGLVVISMMLRWFEHSQVFQPTRLMGISGAELRQLGGQDVIFQSADGIKLNGWFFPGSTNSEGRVQAVLVCHGNGGNISHRVELAEALRSTGMSVFLLDYRGYGRSEGRPSEEGTYQDAVAAYHWLTAKGFEPGRILVYGESLGGGVASELAVRAQTAGLVLQSTFTSIPDLGAELFPWLPVRWLGRVRYETLSKLPRLEVPILVMHSRSDEIVGFRHAQKNFAAAHPPKLFWEIEGTHNSALENRTNFLAGIAGLLKLIEEKSKIATPGPGSQ